MPGRWETLIVDRAPMRVYVNAPAGGPHPGVVVIMQGTGLDAFATGIADRLAAEGYATIAPDLYHREPPDSNGSLATIMQKIGRLRDEQIEHDVNTAIAYLQGMGCPKIGIVGFCMGGRVAYLMAARNPNLAAAVVFYGGNIMNAWGDNPAPFALTPQIHCPVLGLFGSEDTNPSPEDVRQLDAALTAAGKVHEFHIFPGAGHAFMTEGSPRYHAEAAAAAWPKVLTWFAKYLKT
jgi:carboxymethylenebutenolidase